MPFGQSGFSAGGAGIGGDGFFGGLSQLLTAAAPIVSGLFQDPRQAAQQQIGFGPLVGALGRQLPGILGGVALGEGLEGLFGGGGGTPTLFRPTASRIAPVNEFSLIGPDGKCHTWLHATPKGWKVNKSNVSGRRRHHHHRSFH